MYLAKVTGTVVATQKVEGLEGVKLLLVEATDESGTPVGRPAVAVDAVQAGVGEFVYVVTGREAALALDDTFVPVDLAVVGHVDDVNVMDSALSMIGEKRMTVPSALADKPPVAHKADDPGGQPARPSPGAQPSGRASKPKPKPRGRR